MRVTHATQEHEGAPTFGNGDRRVGGETIDIIARKSVMKKRNEWPACKATRDFAATFFPAVQLIFCSRF